MASKLEREFQADLIKESYILDVSTKEKGR